MALEMMLLLLFCSAYLEERTQVWGWTGSPGRKETFFLPLADPQYPLPSMPVSGHVPSFCPDAWSLGGRYTQPLSSPLVHWCLSVSTSVSLLLLSLPLVSGLSIHLSACLPRTHGGRTKLLSPGLRWRTLSLLLLAQPYE